MTTETESGMQIRVADLERRVATLEGRLEIALMEIRAIPVNACREQQVRHEAPAEPPQSQFS